MCEWTCICVKSFRYENTEQVLKTHLKNSRLGKEREREEEEQATSNELKFFKAEEERLIERAGSAEVQKKQWGSGLTVCKALAHLAKPSENLTSASNVMNAFRVLRRPKFFKSCQNKKYSNSYVMLEHSSAHLLSPVHPSFQFILPLLFIFAVLCLVSCVRRRPKAAPSAPVCARASVHLSLPFYSSVCISLSLPLSLCLFFRPLN